MQTYALDTAKGVEKILCDRQQIALRRFQGDYAASDLILDLNTAIDQAKLSQFQAEVLVYRYSCHLSHIEIAEKIGISRQAVQQMNTNACRKIAKVFRKWKYGEVQVELEDAEEDIEVIA